MPFENSPRDTDNVPISSVYVPNVGLIALQGSPAVGTDTLSNTSTPLAASTLGSALAAWGSNPVQTAAAGADTLYKFGATGTTPFAHILGQNSTGATIFLAFDQSTTVAGNKVYAVSAGQTFSFDRSGTVLHVSSPAQQSFGGQTGITIEAFA